MVTTSCQIHELHNPYDNPSIQEERLVDLFKDTIEKSYEEDSIEFSDYDLLLIFHAGAD